MKWNAGKWMPSHATRTRRRFEQHVFPWIEQKAIREVKRGRSMDSTERCPSRVRCVSSRCCSFDLESFAERSGASSISKARNRRGAYPPSA